MINTLEPIYDAYASPRNVRCWLPAQPVDATVAFAKKLPPLRKN